MPTARTITRADLLPVDAYAKVRKERRQALLEEEEVPPARGRPGGQLPVREL